MVSGVSTGAGILAVLAVCLVASFHTKRRSNIYYTGIGAKKDGLHTEEEFLDIAKRYFKECESSTCFKNKSCKLRKKLAKKMQDTNMNVYLNAIDECNKCIKTHKCTTSKEYMKHSGAVVRKS